MINKIFGEIKGLFNIVSIIDLLISFALLVIGIIFYINPEFSNNFVSVFTGVAMIVVGCGTLLYYFKRELLFRNNVIYGIVLVIIGILIIIFKNLLIILLAIYFIVDGVKRINYGLILNKFDESSWLINLVIGLLFVIVGIVSIFTRNGELIKSVGICLSFYGIINVIEIILLRRRSKYFL